MNINRPEKYSTHVTSHGGVKARMGPSKKIACGGVACFLWCYSFAKVSGFGLVDVPDAYLIRWLPAQASTISKTILNEKIDV